MKKKINISFKNSIKFNKLKIDKNLNKNYSEILKEIEFNLDTPVNIFHTLSNNFNLNFKSKDLMRFKKFNNIAVIGMGGSILGAEAIYHFIKKKTKKEFFFFDNINEQKIEYFKKKDLDKTLFLIISKSGNTIETLSNLLTLKILKKNKKNIIIITEKRDSTLYLLSKKLNLFLIEHKNYIGGRYSVLSEVGMVPAYLMGIKISNIRSDLLKHFTSKNKLFLKDSVIKLAGLFNNDKIKNIIFFNYVPQLDKFLYWCQQLIAESLGKKNKGFLPLISPAPKDHHSLLQLFLDGRKDKIFYVFSHENKSKKIINIDKRLKLNNFLNGRDLNSIKNAQKNALIKSFKKNNIPFREFKIKKINEETLGKLFSYFILETVIIGKLLKINPFDQPAVEQVKTYTKNLLS